MASDSYTLATRRHVQGLRPPSVVEAFKAVAEARRPPKASTIVWLVALVLITSLVVLPSGSSLGSGSGRSLVWYTVL